MTEPAPIASGVTPGRLRNLRVWNLGAHRPPPCAGGVDAFGEKSYLVLSLVAKSVLAWQIFGGSLAG